jgi:hypothetical protein
MARLYFMGGQCFVSSLVYDSKKLIKLKDPSSHCSSVGREIDVIWDLYALLADGTE